MKVRAARAARLFLVIQPIRSLFSGVVVAVAVVHLSSLLLHDVATCVGMAGHTRATFSTQHKFWMFMCPWHATNGTSTHALVQQCRVNEVKRVQHQTSSKMLLEKFDRFQI